MSHDPSMRASATPERVELTRKDVLERSALEFSRRELEVRGGLPAPAP